MKCGSSMNWVIMAGQRGMNDLIQKNLELRRQRGNNNDILNYQ